MENKKPINKYLYSVLVIAIIALLMSKGYFLFKTQHQQINYLANHLEGLQGKERELKELKVLARKKKEEVEHFRKSVEKLETLIVQLLYVSSLLRKEKFDYSKIYANTYLYEVSGNGLEKSSYLYGLSNIKGGDFNLPEEVKEAIEKTDHLLMELDYDNEELIKERMALQNALLDAYDKMDIEPVHTKPFFTYLKKYDQDPNIRFIGFNFANLACLLNGDVQCDTALLHDAFKQKGKSISALKKENEAIEQTKNSLEKDNLATLANLLAFLCFYEQDASFRKKQKKIYDEIILYKPNLENFPTIADEVTIYNKQVLPDIEQHMKSQSVFIALDTDNLLGGGSLLTQLLKRGYTVYRINKDGTKTEVTFKNTDIINQCFT